METGKSTELYIKYKGNSAVSVDTSHGRGPQKTLSLSTVSHLIEAFQARRGSLLANTDSGLITLHLPDGVDRTALSEECFEYSDSEILDPGCLLSSLGSLGSNSKQPLIIKSKNDMDVDYPISSASIQIANQSIASGSVLFNVSKYIR
jgi:hypothetical protein